MTSLQLALALGGAVLILAVWVFNKIQERRVRQRVEGPFRRDGADVLFGGEARPRADGERNEPSFNDATMAAHERVVGEPLAEMGVPAPDEMIQAIIPIEFDQPLSGERILAALQGFRRAGKQTVTLTANREDLWVAIHAGERYETVLMAVQLANRTGALNEIEYSEFVAALEHAVDQLRGSCDIPEMTTTVARARALDARCELLDAQIGVNIANPQGAWSGQAVADLLNELGLTLRTDGRFHALNVDGASLFTVQNAEGAAFRADTLGNLSVTRLTLVLDVPCADPRNKPFLRMIEAATAISSQLNGVIVDDALRTLTPNAISIIEKQVDAVYERLVLDQMPAGSPRALALFQ